jgi:DNA-binding winged helix-turn-helix (wHTH) protein
MHVLYTYFRTPTLNLIFQEALEGLSLESLGSTQDVISVVKASDTGWGVVEDANCFRLFIGIQTYRFSKPVRIGDIVSCVQKYASSTFPKIGSHTLLPESRALLLGEERIALTEKEVDLLLFLIQAHGDGSSRQEILQKVWGYGEGLETHTLETHIYQLRKKIEKNPHQPQIIVSTSTGYAISPIVDCKTA